MISDEDDRDDSDSPYDDSEYFYDCDYLEFYDL